MELDWTIPGVTKDFSVVVYGTDGPVTISHVLPADLDSSTEFPTLERQSVH